MRILIYKRTHVGDPNTNREFGNEGCMGRVRGFRFDAVIGIGGISGWPLSQRIAGKVNWVGRCPTKVPNPIDDRGPLVSFRRKDFRLFEHNGPLLSQLAPTLAKKLYGSRARFMFLSLNTKEYREAEHLVTYTLDSGRFDHLQITAPSIDVCRPICTGEVIQRPRAPHVCCLRPKDLR